MIGHQPSDNERLEAAQASPIHKLYERGHGFLQDTDSIYLHWFRNAGRICVASRGFQWTDGNFYRLTNTLAVNASRIHTVGLVAVEKSLYSGVIPVGRGNTAALMADDEGNSLWRIRPAQIRQYSSYQETDPIIEAGYESLEGDNILTHMAQRVAGYPPETTEIQPPQIMPEAELRGADLLQADTVSRFLIEQLT
jgi:hypothetical protein